VVTFFNELLSESLRDTKSHAVFTSHNNNNGQIMYAYIPMQSSNWVENVVKILNDILLLLVWKLNTQDTPPAEILELQRISITGVSINLLISFIPWKKFQLYIL